MRLKVSRSKNAASLYCFEWLSNPFFQRNLQILAAYVTKSFYLLYRNRYASFIFRGLSCTTKPDKTRADYLCYTSNHKKMHGLLFHAPFRYYFDIKLFY